MTLCHEYVAPVAPPKIHPKQPPGLLVRVLGRWEWNVGADGSADVLVGVEMVTQGILFSNTHNPTRTNVFF